MTLRPFKHVSAQSLVEASKATKKPGATLIAGGTDLLGALKDRIHPVTESPEVLVDLKTIPGLSYIQEDRKQLRIGALTTLAELAKNKVVREKYAALAEAARAVASPQIRNMATLGGNLCQQPRCWYYRAPDNQFHCMRKGGTKCAAIVGDNRYHSIYGGVRMAAPACTATCPGHVEIAAYMERLRHGDVRAAAAILLENNPIPAMTGRICPHTCESRCNRRDLDSAVAIHEVERVIGDYVLEHASGRAGLMKAPSKKLKHTVAVVGSGPAGLSAAFYLAQAGYRVTVFDRFPKAGGMLAYSIPAYRLPRDLVEKQIAALKQMGIQFKLKTTIGKQELSGLKKKYNAVFLATGAWRQRSLALEKSGLLMSGMDFLTRIQLGKPPVLGERVLVIGGGNVAIDVAISAKRMGAKHVTMACLEARDEMPAFPEEIEEALREGIHLLPSWGPHRIVESESRLSGMELVRCTSVLDQTGSFHPSFDPAQKQTVDATEIILAIGQSAELDYVDTSLKTSRGLLKVHAETMATPIKGVFAGGDVTSGPATVIHAVAAGRRAAVAIDQYLNRGKYVKSVARTSPDELIELHGGCFDPSQSRSEADRCLNCSCVAVNASDLAPVLIALDARIRTTKRTVPAGEFFAAGPATCTVLAAGEVVREIEIPAASAKAVQTYLKFRIRNAIDFPIVSLASRLELANGKFKDSRIVFGAVAPLPWRMKEVEAFLEGKAATEETIAVAMELAAAGAQPLARNGFKIQIVKALLKRAILGCRQAD